MGESRRFIFPVFTALLVHGFLVAFKLPFDHDVVSARQGDSIRIAINTLTHNHPVPQKQAEKESVKDLVQPEIQSLAPEDETVSEPMPVIAPTMRKKIVMERSPQTNEQDDSADKELVPVAKEVSNTNQQQESAKPVLLPATEVGGESSKEESFQELEGVASGDSEAMPLYLQNRQPEYPELARRRGFTGEVLLHVSVNSAGSVAEIVVKQSSGHTSLDSAAVRSVRHWRFVPGKKNGIPVTMWVDVPIRFTLN